MVSHKKRAHKIGFYLEDQPGLAGGDNEFGQTAQEKKRQSRATSQYFIEVLL